MQHFEIRALALTSRLLVVVCLLFATAAIAFSQTPQLSISDVTLTEGDDPQVLLSSAEVVISLSSPATQNVTVRVSTQPGTAHSNCQPGDPPGECDFGAGFVDVTIPAGNTSISSSLVGARGDTIVEGDEQFFLNLSNPVNATIADSQAVATIVDDDALILLTQPSSRAAALDSVIFTKETFPIINTFNFSSPENRTRLSVFAIGWKGSAVTATAEDPQHNIFPLTVEFVDKLPVGNTPKALSWLTQVVIKMPDPNQIPNPEDLQIRIFSSGQTSNAVLVNVKPQ